MNSKTYNRNYVLSRLIRDRPDLKAKLDRREFPSIRQAALEAGILQPSFTCSCEPTKAARKIRRHFEGSRLDELLRELSA